MKICGIIAEYNPFHNGHLYHLNQTKSISNCDATIAVMSGNFIQRGLPALSDKWIRTRMALLSGVDLVIELPTYYATASAEAFAYGGVSLLNSLGIVNNISFGSDAGETDILESISNVLVEESDIFKNKLQSELKKGSSFPIARSNAITNILKKSYPEKELLKVLSDSNNILGIEYIKALKKLNSPISPIAIKREGGSYNSLEISGNICSATAIREAIHKNNLEKLINVLPTESLDILNCEILNGKLPMFLENFENEIFYILRKLSCKEISDVLDVSEGLENVIKKSTSECTNIESLIENIKSKRYTRTRIQRILIHILLNIRTSEFNELATGPQYARVLGFNLKGEKILSELSKKSKIPIVTSVNKFLKIASNSQRLMMEKDILSTDIYTLGYQIPAYKKMNLDYTMPTVILK